FLSDIGCIEFATGMRSVHKKLIENRMFRRIVWKNREKSNKIACKKAETNILTRNISTNPLLYVRIISE
ncbi:MAG: hypothetical protein ACD_71C00173G0001, partial [uncultured bacterium (gcode 4)]